MRKKIKINTLKALLAKSGNKCAFPNCNHPIFNDNNLFVAQLAHIEAVSPNGPRYNQDKTVEEINSYDNLMFLCYRHHKEIDSLNEYSVKKIKEIKIKHENKYGELKFSVTESILNSIQKEIEEYWSEIEHINKFEHTADDFKINIDNKATIEDLLHELRDYIANIFELLDIVDKRTKHKYFEIFCLGIPNILSVSSVTIDQLIIKYYEFVLMNEPDDLDLKAKLDILRKEFKDTAKHAGIAD